MTKMRIQKFLSQAGVCSRRAAEILIDQRKVKINGRLAVLGDQVDPERDRVLVQGQPIAAVEDKIYLLLNKPAGYICTRVDRHATKTIYDLLPLELKNRVWPIGRLDKDSSGLLILTNDGELTQKLTHPRFEHEKEYSVKFVGQLDADRIKFLSAGLRTKFLTTLPCRIKVVKPGEIKITLREGQKRQVREMLYLVGCQVTWLQRIREGKLRLGDLPAGKFKFIKKEEII